MIRMGSFSDDQCMNFSLQTACAFSQLNTMSGISFAGYLCRTHGHRMSKQYASPWYDTKV